MIFFSLIGKYFPQGEEQNHLLTEKSEFIY